MKNAKSHWAVAYVLYAYIAKMRVVQNVNPNTSAKIRNVTYGSARIVQNVPVATHGTAAFALFACVAMMTVV